MIKKEIEERIKSRELFLESNVQFLHNYTGSIIEKNIEKFSFFKLAIEIEKKQSELIMLKSLLKLI